MAPEPGEGVELSAPAVPPPAPVEIEPAGVDGGALPPPTDASAIPPPASPWRRHRWLIEWAVIIALAVVVAVVVRAFIFQTFYIPSGSMEPTLQVGDRIVVNKLAYDFHGVHRGDIVVFRTPPNERCAGPPVPDLVKRVIGLPGETLSASHGVVDVNGKPLAEPWLPKGVSTTVTYAFGPVKVPKGDYFMMGDNRVNSCDSRMWGPVPESSFVGHVFFRIWPVSKIKFF